MPSEPERVADDAELVAAARRHYAGAGDLADHLWWLEHPGSRGPSGAEDPLPRLESARAALYRPDRPAGVDAAALQRGLAQVESDRAAARAAVAEARTELGSRRPAAPAPAPHRAILRVLVAAVVALVVGLAIGWTTGRFSTAAAPAALAVLSRAPQVHDRPPATASLPPLAPRSAYRLLASSPSTGAYAYGVPTSSGDVCLVVVVLAQRSYATCTTRAAFVVGGLTLALSVDVDPTDDSGVSRPVGIAPHWAPDGRVTF